MGNADDLMVFEFNRGRLDGATGRPEQKSGVTGFYTQGYQLGARVCPKVITPLPTTSQVDLSYKRPEPIIPSPARVPPSTQPTSVDILKKKYFI